MAYKIEKPYEVLDGPSREELFDALRLRGEQRLVRFDYNFYNNLPENDERRSVFVKVYRLTAPMGISDPNDWMVEGMSIAQGHNEYQPVMIIFNTKRRIGTIIFNYDTPTTPSEADEFIREMNPLEPAPSDATYENGPSSPKPSH